MLILTRRVGETVMIGNEVTVTVLAVKGNQVRIGVNAPKDVAVHREEIYDRIRREDDGDSQARRTCKNCRRRLNQLFRHPWLYLDSSRQVSSRAPRKAELQRERWPSGRRRAPAKGVRVKSPYSSREDSPIIQALTTRTAIIYPRYCQPTASSRGFGGSEGEHHGAHSGVI